MIDSSKLKGLIVKDLKVDVEKMMSNFWLYYYYLGNGKGFYNFTHSEFTPFLKCWQQCNIRCYSIATVNIPFH